MVAIPFLDEKTIQGVNNMGDFVVGTDFSPISTLALKACLAWSKKFNEDARMIHIDDIGSKLRAMSAQYSLETSISEIYDFTRFRKILDEQILKQLKEAGVEKGSLQVDLDEGERIDKILNFIKKNRASLLFMGAGGHDLIDRLLLGSTTEKLAHISPIPLVIVRDQGVLNPKKILFPVDFSPLCYKTMDWIKELATVYQSEVYLIHYVSTDLETTFLLNPDHLVSTVNAKEYFDQKAVKASQEMEVMKSDLLKQKIKCKSKVEFAMPGDIAQEIFKEVQKENADVVFTASHSKNPLQRFLLGSVALKLLRQCPKSIFLMNEGA